MSFALPSARGRVQPHLEIAYGSSNGDLEAGVGWGLSLPSIVRRSPSGLVRPLYRDPPKGGEVTDWDLQDRFYFSGQPLVPVCFIQDASGCSSEIAEAMPNFTQAGGWYYYRLQTDDGQALRFFWSPDHMSWIVQDKAGNTTELGVPQDGNYAPANAVDSEPLVISGTAPTCTDGARCPPASAPFRWNLSRQYDANRLTTGEPANPVVYTWTGPGKRHMLADIFYTSPVTPWPGLSLYAHHVHLSWQPYSFPTATNTPTWRSSSLNLLSGVDVTSADLTGGQLSLPTRNLVRRYHLTYAQGNHHATLSTFQLEGRCAQPIAESSSSTLPAITSCPTLPATTFAYDSGAGFVWNTLGADLKSADGQALQLANTTTVPMDVNADGLPDFVSTAPSPACLEAVEQCAAGAVDGPVYAKCWSNSFCHQQTQTVFINGETSLDTLSVHSMNVGASPSGTPLVLSSDARPDTLTPGATSSAINAQSPGASAVTPGLRAYTGDFSGDGHASIYWFNSYPNISQPCAPPAMEPWDSALYEIYSPDTAPAPYGGVAWELLPTATAFVYDVPNGLQFAWLGAGDIDGDGYLDRLSTATLFGSPMTPGQCYTDPSLPPSWRRPQAPSSRRASGTARSSRSGAPRSRAARPCRSRTRDPKAPSAIRSPRR